MLTIMLEKIKTELTLTENSSMMIICSSILTIRITFGDTAPTTTTTTTIITTTC